MIGTDSHRSTILLTYFNKWRKFLPDARELTFIRIVCILDYLEPFLIGIVAGIDPHLLHNSCSKLSRVWCEMDICNERNGAASFSKFFFYLFKVLSLFQTRSRDANVFTAGSDHAQNL